MARVSFGTPIVVSGTKIVYTPAIPGAMVLRFQARTDYADWPAPGQTYSYLTPMPSSYMSGGYVIVVRDTMGVRC